MCTSSSWLLWWSPPPREVWLGWSERLKCIFTAVSPHTVTICLSILQLTEVSLLCCCVLWRFYTPVMGFMGSTFPGVGMQKWIIRPRHIQLTDSAPPFHLPPTHRADRTHVLSKAQNSDSRLFSLRWNEMASRHGYDLLWGWRQGSAPHSWSSARLLWGTDHLLYPKVHCYLPFSYWESQIQACFFFFFLIDYAKAFDCVDHNKLWKILKEMGIPDCVDHNKLWKILKEMGIPDHLICLLRNLYAGQEATIRTGHGTTDWFQIGKGVRQGCILSPCLFNLYAEYIMRNAGLEEAQAGIKIVGRNINNLRYADDTTLMA